MKKANYKDEFEKMGYKCLAPINEAESKKNIIHLYKDGNYIASIKKTGDGGFSFNRKKYTDKDRLIEAINEYNSKLEFNPSTYDPDMRDDYRTEIRIYNTLKDFGFEPGGKFRDSDNMVSEGVVGMHYGQVLRQKDLCVGDGWIEMYGDGAKSDSDKCRSIKSYLYAMYAANIAKLCVLLNKSGTIGKLGEIKVKRLNEETLMIEEKDITEEIKGIMVRCLAIIDKQ